MKTNNPLFWKPEKRYAIDVLHISIYFRFPAERHYKNNFIIKTDQVFTKYGNKSKGKMILFSKEHHKTSNVNWSSYGSLNNLLIRGHISEKRKQIALFCTCEMPLAETILDYADNIIDIFLNAGNNRPFPFRIRTDGSFYTLKRWCL